MYLCGEKKNEMEKSVLDKITTSNWGYYYEGWRNGKKGGFVQKLGIYRFHEQRRDKDGNLYDVYEKEEDNQIVAMGIVANWLIFNSRKDDAIKRLTFYRVKIPKDIREQFENYTKIRFDQFKNDHRDDPNTWDWDWEYEFYTKYIIPHELKLNKISESLFDYISDSDIETVRTVMKNYIRYLKKLRSEKGYRVNPELLVLRAIKSRDETEQEDLEEFEVNTILDKLEKKGYIQVIWDESHKPQLGILLNKGRAYLKHLEEGGVAKGTKPVIREITWEIEKQCFKNAVLYVMTLERKEAGNYLFNKNSLWIAVYRFAVDLGIMYDLDDPNEPEDTSTPQYTNFEDFAHELQLDVNPPTRLPFSKNAINCIKSNKSYIRYNTRYPWSKDGIKDLRSFTFYTELEDVYLALEEGYNNFVRQAERTID